MSLDKKMECIEIAEPLSLRNQEFLKIYCQAMFMGSARGGLQNYSFLSK